MSFTTEPAQCGCSSCSRILDALAFDATAPAAPLPEPLAQFEGGEALPRVLPLTAISPESGNEFTDSIISNGRHYVNPEGTDGPFVVDYFFDKLDGPVNPETGRGTPYDWRPFEKRSWQQAAETWTNVADVDFNEVFTREEALFRERLQDQATAGGTVSASHNLPSANPEAQSLGTYNFEAVNVRQWTPDQIEPGGNFYRTIIHEVGHGLGLKHPHDSGSLAFAPNYFPGIDPAATSAERQRSLGLLDLNHMFGSVMSYIHGYEFDEQGLVVEVPTRQRPVAEDFFLDHGFAATPMAYDIAAIQYLYGANTAFRTGDNVYLLPNSNDPRPFVRGAPNEAGVPEAIIYQPDTAFWQSIWDAGGTDEIRYDVLAPDGSVSVGSRNTIIDLTAATLDATETSRGVLSYAAFIGGGYTIANGVVIENATGGNGQDRITGNAANNVLAGRGGDDTLAGAGGADTINGGDGNDTAVFAAPLTNLSLSDYGTRIEVTDANGAVSLVSGVEELRFLGGSLVITGPANDGGPLVDRLVIAGLVGDGDPLVDSLYYLAANPDVLAAGVAAPDHYYRFGAAEGRDPNAHFDTSAYLASNPDVAAAGMNPLAHYLQFGASEGRDPSALFDTSSYVAANRDVAAAGVNPLQHYLSFGRAEGRAAVEDIGASVGIA